MQTVMDAQPKQAFYDRYVHKYNDEDILQHNATKDKGQSLQQRVNSNVRSLPMSVVPTPVASRHLH